MSHEISKQLAVRLLKAGKYGVLSFIYHGDVQTYPLVYATDEAGEHIYLHGNRNKSLSKMLETAPRAKFVVVTNVAVDQPEFTLRYQSVIVEGQIAPVAFADPQTKVAMVATVKKYIGTDFSREHFKRTYQNETPDLKVYDLKVATVSGRAHDVLPTVEEG
ncbi:MAG TPA: hypothetical protein DCW31_06030 [Lactobacillus sp.]|nr:hypothetical protein [Lactobacillus sp.]